MKTGHTPGQLEVREGAYIFASDGSYIARTTGNVKAYQGEETDKANARRFVLTWNCHDGLLVALEKAKEHLGLLFYWDAGERFCGHCKRSVRADHRDDCPINIIDQAIAKAKAGA